MPGLERVGLWLVIGGVGLVVLGGAIWLLARLFPNLSQLPGTIRIQGAGFTCIFPLLASIVVSILLTIVLNIIIRMINK
ncbi:MAG TPA: DUF2905 domain-containing protein [Anaerolineaceae bacterium]